MVEQRATVVRGKNLSIWVLADISKNLAAYLERGDIGRFKKRKIYVAIRPVHDDEVGVWNPWNRRSKKA